MSMNDVKESAETDAEGGAAATAAPEAADAARETADPPSDQSPPSDQEAPSAAAEAPPDPDKLAADAARIRALFAVDGAEDGAPAFRTARWGRPIRLAVFGAEPASAEAIAAAVAEAAAVAGASLEDPAADGAEASPNFIIYLCEEWAALADAPGLRAIEPDLDAVLAQLAASDANEHRLFKVSRREGLLAAVSLLRANGKMAAMSGQAAALGQAARGLALWSEAGLAAENPIALRRSGRAAFKGWFARLMGALYAEGAPLYSEDPAYAETLAASLAASETPPARAEADAGDGVRKRKRRRRGDKAKDAAAGAAAVGAEEASGAAEPSVAEEAPSSEEAPSGDEAVRAEDAVAGEDGAEAPGAPPAAAGVDDVAEGPAEEGGDAAEGSRA